LEVADYYDCEEEGRTLTLDALLMA
jgi:hypothetical protein